MAAELEMIVNAYTCDVPERNTSILFDCLESRQLLQNHNCTESWISKINSLLNSRDEKWLGLSLLSFTVQQCDTDTFTTNCINWLKPVLQILQSPIECSSSANLCAKIFDQILQYAAQFSELSRELSTTVIPPLVSALPNKKTQNLPLIFGVLTSCINHFPGPLGPFKNRIENLLLAHLESRNENTRKAACACFAALPRCGGSGTEGKKHSTSWEEQLKRIINSVHKILDNLYEAVNQSGDHSMQYENALPLRAVPEVEPSRTSTLLTQLKALILCLSSMLSEEFQKVVSVPLGEIVQLICKALAVTDISMQNAVTIESVLLKASLPSVHTWVFRLLHSLILRCGNHLLPFCTTVISLSIQELSWTVKEEKRHGCNRPFSQLRCAVYNCVEAWAQQTGIISDNTEVLAKLVNHIVEDIKPRTFQTKLLTSTTAENTQPKSKKAKKRKIQEDVEQLLTEQQKSDLHANAEVTTYALKALCSIIMVCGSEISLEAYKVIQTTVLSLILSCQRSANPKSYPVPYSNPECRQYLYRVLQCCLLSSPPFVPSVVHYAVKLFSSGLQDSHPVISSYCRESLSICLAIIHPRVPTLGPIIEVCHLGDAREESAVDPSATFIARDSAIREENHNLPINSLDTESVRVTVNERSQTSEKENVTERSPTSASSICEDSVEVLKVPLSRNVDVFSEIHERMSYVAQLQCSNSNSKQVSGQEMIGSRVISGENSLKEAIPDVVILDEQTDNFVPAPITKDISPGHGNQKDEPPLAKRTRMEATSDEHSFLVRVIGDKELDPEIPNEANKDQIKVHSSADEDSDEADKMLDTFVDSGPDSDDQEMA